MKLYTRKGATGVEQIVVRGGIISRDFEQMLTRDGYKLVGAKTPVVSIETPVAAKERLENANLVVKSGKEFKPIRPRNKAQKSRSTVTTQPANNSLNKELDMPENEVKYDFRFDNSHLETAKFKKFGEKTGSEKAVSSKKFADTMWGDEPSSDTPVADAISQDGSGSALEQPSESEIAAAGPDSIDKAARLVAARSLNG